MGFKQTKVFKFGNQISMYNLPFYLFIGQNKIFLKFKSQITLSDTSSKRFKFKKKNLSLEENMNKIIRI